MFSFKWQFSNKVLLKLSIRNYFSNHHVQHFIFKDFFFLNSDLEKNNEILSNKNYDSNNLKMK